MCGIIDALNKFFVNSLFFASRAPEMFLYIVQGPNKTVYSVYGLLKSL